MNDQVFNAFFEEYAKNVDNADKQQFWKLSDAIIYAIIRLHIPPGRITPNQVIMDAGGGTGRWIVKLADTYPCSFLLFDKSEDMIAQARENIASASLDGRVRIVHGDMCDMRDVADASVDHVISIYSPMSFIDRHADAATELFRVLRPGGVAFIMGHGKLNAIASKLNACASAEEIRDLEETAMVAWGPRIPPLVTFSKESMESLLSGAGFSVIATYGVPVFVQPGPEDWDAKNIQRSTISNALADPEWFRTSFEVEMKYNALPTVANRGMNMLTVAKKI
jgi:ubiquinone/menaquinone biosynthesis C-methylase UbiE